MNFKWHHSGSIYFAQEGMNLYTLTILINHKIFWQMLQIPHQGAGLIPLLSALHHPNKNSYHIPVHFSYSKCI